MNGVTGLRIVEEMFIANVQISAVQAGIREKLKAT